MQHKVQQQKYQNVNKEKEKVNMIGYNNNDNDDGANNGNVQNNRLTNEEEAQQVNDAYMTHVRTHQAKIEDIEGKAQQVHVIQDNDDNTVSQENKDNKVNPNVAKRI